jgi:elongation factor G
MSKYLETMRNIGISAHIDSGKTTLTERILFYTNRINRIHEVRGRDGIGATMDSMELERERGITIQSASTHVEWKNHKINIIDTPGHVDFTIEVERSLRVLDGAILVLCAVGGVQSQSLTVDRQMSRYKVPRLAFINKMDRMGANPFKVVQQLEDKLNHNAILMQLPIGKEADFEGIIDLVKMKAFYFQGEFGEKVLEKEIPADDMSDALEKRDILLDTASMYSDELAEAYLEDRVSEDLVYEAVRAGTLSLEMTPVFLGSAFKNKGVQPLLEAVNKYLPSPYDIENTGLDLDHDEMQVSLESNPEKPAVLLAFKLDDTRFGQLTYIRLYQGSIQKGDDIINMRTGKKVRVGRLIRMHADKMQDIEKAQAGEIVAMFGVDCASGDTFTDGSVNITMTSMYVPDPVISLSVNATDNKSAENMAKALNRFNKEDPTFQSGIDPETHETIIKGMGELHLDVYLERMRREYNVSLDVGPPQVAYRESISQKTTFDYTHKKQTGGAGQYARVAGIIEPFRDGEEDFEFFDEIKGGVIPSEYIPACRKGFETALHKGPLTGFPIVGVRVTLNDGNYHAVDSSDMAFQTASWNAFRHWYSRCKPVILEPIMRVSVEAPSEYQGNIIGTLNQRRGIITSATEDNAFTHVETEVPLSEMFGYSTILRSATQGKAEFTMEFSKYGKVPENIAEDLKKEFVEKNKS